MFNDKICNQNNMKECDEPKSHIGSKLRKHPEDRRPNLHRGGSLTSPRLSLPIRSARFCQIFCIPLSRSAGT